MNQVSRKQNIRDAVATVTVAALIFVAVIASLPLDMAMRTDNGEYPGYRPIVIGLYAIMCCFGIQRLIRFLRNRQKGTAEHPARHVR